MSVLMRKTHHFRLFTGMKRLALVIFIFSLSAAFIDTIWAVYLDGFFHNDSMVGFFSGFLSIISFLCFFALVPLVEKSNKAKLFSMVVILFSISYLILALTHNFWIFVLFSVTITILSTLKIMSFGIIVKDNSKNKSLSENEGMMYTFSNVAWVIGPLIAGFISFNLGIPFVFFISSFLLLFAFLLFKLFRIKDEKDKNYRKVDLNIIGNFFNFFRSKERVIAYILGGGVNLWWALIYLYTPLYIIHNGLNEKWIGIFLFAVAVPLMSFEYYFSKFAGKHGFRKIFFIGYLLPAVMVLTSFFIGNVYFVLSFLVFGSVGMAMLEPTTEAYFFDMLKNKREEDKYYGPYNTAIDVGIMMGKFAPAILLIFLPFKYIFLLFAMFMFFLAVTSLKTKKIVESKR
ncbi:hypothetical protein COU59_01295 [Candidatus Pacearchaeota archaeon CG10_big_fil_rev_8_21_14_0_10_34_12]|nr:MAG: hypothetical protein COU59_01295 [Candidatus Pacearchaeota archaeon CG10_big_fil_rev_8_21_14_0_10_34_12]